MKIRLHYLLGDVHFGGHDVYRVASAAKKLLAETNAFDILTVYDEPGLGDITWDDYFAEKIYSHADAFIFNCGNYRFNIPSEQEILEKAVSGGAGFILMHGDHPCYWKEVGMSAWPGFERMAGFLWREKTTHGDYGSFRISVENHNHPIMRGLPDFDTKDEVFCTMENPHNVPFEVLASAYSNPQVISRHGAAGTGRQEPVAITGNYGKGRTFNLSLGHVWPFYTGHGLGENTLAAWSAKPLRIMFVRACEWAATGEVARTQNFNGEVRLRVTVHTPAQNE
ncbi:MAG: ThuA domain-containing protein [Clostridiales bacterium]|nr:ThuA domain-containing protein [Clostridiales bacterium]